jgi:cytochrome c biogenesis protein CcdA
MLALAVALLLGLRHATDPDHLTAVSTLVMSEEPAGARRATKLGASWGIGHALTLFLLGVPVVVFRTNLPEWLQNGFELAVGVVIVALAGRLLLRWRRGYFHVHEHTHGEVRHVHPHVHESASADPHPHHHSHPHELARSPLAAFGVGLLHGAGGSAGAAVLVVAGTPDRGAATASLAVLAIGTAISMTAITAAFGTALARGPLPRNFDMVAPILGTLSLVFGVWYGLAALSAVPYFL